MLVIGALVLVGILTLLGEAVAFLGFLPHAQFWLLGYFGYVWAFGAAFVLYQTKAIPTFQNPLEKGLGLTIIAFALLVLQGLFFENAGILGVAFYNVLKPIITSLGVFILSLLMLGFGVVLYTEKSPKELYSVALNALKDDLKKDLKHAKISKDKLHKNTEKLKIFWLKTKAFFALPVKKDSIVESSDFKLINVESNMESKNLQEKKDEFIENQKEILKETQEVAQIEQELRSLTLDELIEQSKNNPQPKENIAFNFQDKEEQDDYAESQDESKVEFEEGIDELRQDIELPMREDNPLEEISKEPEDEEIRVINAKNLPQDSFDATQFQIQSMASLENFKRFEKSYYKEEKEEEPIRLIKKESIGELGGELEQTPPPKQEFAQQESLQKESSRKQAIKSYPKNLYAATPFSAYYDKEPVGTHDRLVDASNFQKEYPDKKNTLPKTIFYYGDKVSTHPLSENSENMESKNAEVKNTEITNQTAQTLENTKSENIIPQQEIPQATIQTPQIQATPQIQEIVPQPEIIPQYSTIPNTIPTFGYGYAHYQEPIQQITQPIVIEQTMESKILTTAPQQVAKPQEPQVTESIQAQQAPIQTPKQEMPLAQIPQLQEIAPQPVIQTQSVQTPQVRQEPQQSVEIVKTLEENAALLETLEMAQTPQMLESKDYELPKLEFLQEPKRAHIEIDESEIDRKINDLLNKMRVFKIEGDIVRTYSGPIVTTFEFRPSPNVKVSRILTLQDDLAMALRAKTIRIQAPIPGKDVVGIEIPNAQVETIYLREILENDLFKNSLSPLTLALGKDIVGNPFVTDLKKLPHLLIAGTTGSGKSVGINAMILSLLYKNPPDKLKLIMVDPKMVEFSIYNDIPHLLTPVITNPKNAIFALDVAVKEMEQRNALISEARVKNIDSYNQKAEMEGFEPFPYIVIIIDELADLMMTGGKEAEASISRLTQMARSSGIHLIVATQRPSVDVVTGLIKANLPSRISYKVGQKIDSKVILDCHGAESLLGNGDMLFAMGGGNVTRLHAPFSTEEEIERIVEFIKAQCPPQYDERFLQKEERAQVQSNGEADDLYEEAKRIMLADGKTSISYIQRRLGIGFNKAANIVEQMQQRGFLSKENSKGVREIIGE